MQLSTIVLHEIQSFLREKCFLITKKNILQAIPTVLNKYTVLSYKNYKHEINPLNLPRGNMKYHIDHIFSKSKGFDNNIPAYIIGNQSNLQMLTHVDNSRKGAQCWITAEELFSKIFK